MRPTSPISPHALLVYSRVGGGHFSAATALAEELHSCGCTVRLVDAYVECGRFPLQQFPRVYAWLARRHPRWWSLIYGTTSHRLNPDVVLGPFLGAGLRQRVAIEQPHVIVSVLPAINGLLAQTQVRVEVVLTDWHAVHRFWVSRGVDHYTAPTPSAHANLVHFGAPAADIDVIGIPVRRQFSVNEPHTDPRRFTIIAMVGAEGSPRALRNLAALARSDIDAELVVVCGRNQRLQQAIARLPSRMQVRALGYVEDVASLLRSASVLVTKAGGLTLAEAFCCGAPVVIHDVVPGQETGNLQYMLAHRAAVYAPTPSELVQTVANLARDSAARAQLAQCGARLARPHAASEIAANILARLEAAS